MKEFVSKILALLCVVVMVLGGMLIYSLPFLLLGTVIYYAIKLSIGH